MIYNNDMDYSLERFEADINIEDYIRDYVDVERFLECCKACPNYGKVWSCAPYDFDPLEIWNSYEKLRVIGYRITFGNDRTREEMIDAEWKVKRKLGRELFEMEDQFPGSMQLSAGSCDICKACTRKQGTPCAHPDLMRYSIESIGGNVAKTIEDLCGIEIEWIEGDSLPEHFVLVGGLLMTGEYNS